MSRKTINVYAEFPAETGSLWPCLRETFNGSSVVINYVRQKDILDGSAFADPTSVIVLPGAPHGNGYRDQLGGKGFAMIRKHVEGGGAVLNICGPSYLAMSSYSYLTNEGILKEFSSDFALIDGHAHGPLLELFDPDRQWGGRWAQHAVARLIFNGSTEHRDAGVCYSRGAALWPREKCDIIAQFRDVASQPPAIIGKALGKGYVVNSAVSIELNGEMMHRMVTPKNDHLRDGRLYASELAKFEKSRAAIWTHIWNDRLDVPVPPSTLRV